MPSSIIFRVLPAGIALAKVSEVVVAIDFIVVVVEEMGRREDSGRACLVALLTAT